HRPVWRSSRNRCGSEVVEKLFDELRRSAFNHSRGRSGLSCQPVHRPMERDQLHYAPDNLPSLGRMVGTHHLCTYNPARLMKTNPILKHCSTLVVCLLASAARGQGTFVYDQ